MRKAPLPGVLLAADVLLIALATSGVPLRLVWHGVGFTMLYLACWWVLSRLATAGRRISWLLVLSALCVPAAFGRQGGAALSPPAVAVADVGSDRLWSVTLGAGQALGRLQPVRTEPGGPQLQIRVRLGDAYGGPARLLAAVNGVSLGALSVPEREDAGHYEAFVPVPESVLACRAPLDGDSPCAGAIGDAPRALPVPPLPVRVGGDPPFRAVAVVIWQDRADSRLRLVVQRAAGGAALGADNSWFFDGEGWRQGVVHAASGRVTAGLWHVFLAPGQVGR